MKNSKLRGCSLKKSSYETVPMTLISGITAFDGVAQIIYGNTYVFVFAIVLARKTYANAIVPNFKCFYW